MVAYLIAPLEALTDPMLTDPERRVLLSLFSFRGRETNTVWPSIMSISERANINDHTRVSKLTSSLANKGWLTKKKRGFTGGNEYSLVVPGRLTNLDSETKLAPETKLDPDTASNLDPDTKSNLDPDAKYKEHTNEHTNEQTNGHDHLTGFDDFWEAYGKKVKRKDSERVWRSLSSKDRELATSVAARRKRHDQAWAKEGGKFQPDPTTFLRGKRWNDEWDEPVKSISLEEMV